MKMISTTLLLIMSFNLFAQYNAEKVDCESKGKTWIEGQGCKVSAQTQAARDQVSQCAELEGAAQDQCVAQATEILSNSVTKQDKSMHASQNPAYAAAIIASAATGFALITSPGACIQPSYWLIFAGSVAALYGEISARKKYKKLIVRAKENYESLETQENSSGEEKVTNKQLAAFDHLIEIENAREQAEKRRKSLHAIAFYSYSAAAVMAALEGWLPYFTAQESTCQSAVGSVREMSLPNQKSVDVGLLASYDKSFEPYIYLGRVSFIEFVEISLRKVSEFIIPSAIAQEVSVGTAGAVAGGTAAVGAAGAALSGAAAATATAGTVGAAAGAAATVGTFGATGVAATAASATATATTTTVATASVGASGSSSGMLSIFGPKTASFIKSASKSYAKLFTSAWTRLGIAAVLGTGAVLLSKQAKKNMETSQKRQAELQKIRNQFAGFTSVIGGRCSLADRKDSSNPNCFCYLEDGTKDASKRNLVVCVENWGNSDVTNAGNYNASTNTTVNSGIQTCITKSYESDLGCKCKSNSSCLTIKPKSFNSNMAWTSPVFAASNSAYSNGLESADFKSDDYIQKAGNFNRKLEEMKKDPKFKDVFDKASSIEAKIKAGTLRSVQQAIQDGSLGSIQSFGGSSDSDISEAKKKKAKIVASLPKKFSSALKAKKLESFDLDFGEGNDSGVEVVGEDANANADYKYDAVLHKNPDANIFKILSNRYMKTGVKNLFEEKIEEKAQ